MPSAELKPAIPAPIIAICRCTDAEACYFRFILNRYVFASNQAVSLSSCEAFNQIALSISRFMAENLVYG